MTGAEAITRRRILSTLGGLGVGAAAAALAPTPARARAEASPALGVPEPVADGLRRLFGDRPIRDGSGVIKLDIPLIAENGAAVPVSVEVNGPMTAAQYVKHIYVVADKNPIPIVTRVTLTPEAGVPFLGANIRLAESGDVRAIAERSDGTLLGVKRAVTVTVSGCG